MQSLFRQHALTICIPSYNRRERVYALVLFLKRNLLPLTDDVEIVIVNNCSTDGTQQRLEPLVSPRVKLINRTVFLPTAEENMFESLEYCNGDYVWYHGDDEVPICDTVLRLIEMIKQDVADLFVFNSSLIDERGASLARNMVPMEGSHVDVTGDGLVQAAGFTFMLAGITNVVLRRRDLDVSIAREALSVQKIYAHVCWILRCFHDKRTRICNSPLVFYRNGDPAALSVHFLAYSQKTGIGDHHFWGIGIARQLEYLVGHGALTAAAISTIFEGRRDGTRFKLLHECVYRIFCQIEVGLASGEARNKITSEDLSLARDFLISCDLFMFDLFEPLERMNEIAWQQRPSGELNALRKRFLDTFREHDKVMYRHCARGQCYGYDIYQMPMHWIAVDPGIPGGVEPALAVLDLREAMPYVWLDEHFEQLAARLAAYRQLETSDEQAVRKRHSLELLMVGRRFAELAERTEKVYSARVEIARQATLPVRLFVKAGVSALRFARRVARRLLRR